MKEEVSSGAVGVQVISKEEYNVIFSAVGILSVSERLMDSFFLTTPTCEDLEALQRSLGGVRLLISSLMPKVDLPY